MKYLANMAHSVLEFKWPDKKETHHADFAKVVMIKTKWQMSIQSTPFNQFK
jgi:hypothetical protein